MFNSDHLICKHYNLSWLNLQDRVNWGDYICLYAESLVQEEEDTYRWWVNSQQDPKKFKWLYNVKSYMSQAASTLLGLIKSVIADPNKPNPIRGSAYEYAKATGNPIVFMKDGKYYSENMTPKPEGYDARKDKKAVVVRINA